MEQAGSSDDRQLLEALRLLEQRHARLLNEIAELQHKLGYDELLPLKVAAAEVGYNQETVRLWVAKRRIAGERCGGCDSAWGLDCWKFQQQDFDDDKKASSDGVTIGADHDPTRMPIP